MAITSSVEVREINQPIVEVDEENGEVMFESHDGVQLSAAEIAFVEHYCGDAKFVASKAYGMMKGKTKDWNAIGSKWLMKPHIQKAIKWRLDAMGSTREELLTELKDLAMSEWRDHVEVKMADGEIVSVKMDLMPKVRAAEIYLRALGELDNKQNFTIPIQVNINTNIPEQDLA